MHSIKKPEKRQLANMLALKVTTTLLVAALASLSSAQQNWNLHLYSDTACTDGPNTATIMFSGTQECQTIPTLDGVK